MKKNISAALLSVVCFSAVSAAAFADGPVAGAINGIGRAGEDIADGAGNLINGIVNGVTAAPGVDEDGDSDPDDSVTSDGDVTSDVESGDNTDSENNAASGDTSDDVPASESSDVLDPGVSDSPASDSDVNSAGASNPGTGVGYGFTAAAAVLAAAGVAAGSARRKR